MDEVLALLRRAEGLSGARIRDHLRALAPFLDLGADRSVPLPPRAPDETGAGADIARAGFARLPGALSKDTANRWLDGIERLTAARLPAMFIYCYDDPWWLGEQLAERVSRILGHRYSVVEDVWAWRIAAGAGRGWPAHRGVDAPLLARNAPQLLNTWVALSDVEVDRACMHFVPLDEDPAYPHALDVLDAPAAGVRRAPLIAGDALAWNANILHWGGVCAPDAKGARVSCSFSLVRADAASELGIPLASGAARDLRLRLDAVARQLLVYGAGQADVAPEVLAWARGNAAIASASAWLHGP